MAEPTIPILDAQRVTKRFAFGDETITALSEASLSIAKGEFICLIGPSGCGKSTLLRMVGGFETASEGALLMWGKPVGAPGPDRGMVFQDYGLFPWLTVTENIAFGPLARGRPKAALIAGPSFAKKAPVAPGSIASIGEPWETKRAGRGEFTVIKVTWGLRAVSPPHLVRGASCGGVWRAGAAGPCGTRVCPRLPEPRPGHARSQPPMPRRVEGRGASVTVPG